MTAAEVWCAVIEEEALAITWTRDRFHYYLVRKKFEIETDHKLFVSVLGEKCLSCLPMRVKRFKFKLMRS